MKTTRIKDILQEENPDVILPDGMEEALLGINRENNPIGVYSYLKSIELLIKNGLTEEEALDENIFLYKGENCPIYIDDTGV
tara:strand:+ start:139 stop:384 length:246 start_codon:yes stop_codon:yes gene_type:complete